MKKKISKKILRAREDRAVKRNNKQLKKNMVEDMFKRDGGVCVFCGKPVHLKHYQTCHIIPEQFAETRYDLNNVLLACFYHHRVGKYSMHNHPLWFVSWLEKNRPEQYSYLKEKLK